MSGIIISDTSCLILLEKIGEMDLLRKLFRKVTTTSEVAAEFGLPLPAWIEVRNPRNKNYQTIIEASVDKGEASAIALALENRDCLLIMDDLKGRKFASQQGIRIVGTFGVLVEAKLAGIVPAVKPILEKIRTTNFRISEDLEKIILRNSEE